MNILAYNKVFVNELLSVTIERNDNKKTTDRSNRRPRQRGQV